jgi:anti-anti-sigma regulatory factor
MPTQSLVFRVSHDGALVAPATCGLLAIPDFLAQVQRCAAEGGPVVVDLSEVVVFDMAAFRSLVWARRYCMARGVRFAAVAPPPGVFRRQEEVILRDLLPVHPDRASARGALPGDAVEGAPFPAQRTTEDEDGCGVPGCTRPVLVGGRCSRHHLRWLRYRACLDRQPG